MNERALSDAVENEGEGEDEERLEHSRVLHILIAGRLLGPMWALIIGLAAQPLAAMLIYILMAVILAFKPQGLFAAHD